MVTDVFAIEANETKNRKGVGCSDSPNLLKLANALLNPAQL